MDADSQAPPPNRRYLFRAKCDVESLVRMLSCLNPIPATSARRRTADAGSRRSSQFSDVFLTFDAQGVRAQLKDASVELSCILKESFFFHYRFRCPIPMEPGGDDVMDVDDDDDDDVGLDARPGPGPRRRSGLVDRDKVVLKVDFQTLLSCLQIFSGSGRRRFRRAQQQDGSSSAVAVLFFPGEDGRLFLKLTEASRTAKCNIGVMRCAGREFVDTEELLLLEKDDGDAIMRNDDDDDDAEGVDELTMMTRRRKRKARSLAEQFDGWAEIGHVVLHPNALLEMLNEALWIDPVVYVELNGRDKYLQFEVKSAAGLFLQETLSEDSNGISSFRCGDSVHREQYNAKMLACVAGALRRADKDCTEVNIRLNEKAMLQFNCVCITDVELQFTLSPSVHLDEEEEGEIPENDIVYTSSSSDSSSGDSSSGDESDSGEEADQ